ncbi:Lin0512 family protein, partial [Octadecabacter sp.]|nr:Lin0512 family protein [Octadecabacter sp.]
YGQLSFVVVHGGLDVPRPDGLPTVIANVALSVALEIPA